jgi:hypothetical protein
VIDYPDDRSIAAEADRHNIPEPVLVRDLVRVVEVLNLKAKDFFSERSVLAGSMALRCFDSPRFTVYDADFSTSSQTISPATAMKDKLAYRDDDLAYIALVSRPGDSRLIELHYPRVREVLDGKLSTMKNLQPNIYTAFPNIQALIDDLARKPRFNSMQWAKIMYLRNKRDRFSQAHLTAAVMGILVPGLKGI